MSGGGRIHPERRPVADVPLLSDGSTAKGLRRAARELSGAGTR
ncbi:hypothetical protein ACFU3E_22140 [Streptomyces sp. NPDC057424]